MNFQETKLMLKYLDPAQSILLMGDHGLGKSQCVFQAGAELEVPVIDIRLSQADVGDIKGMPFMVKGRTFFAPPDFYPLAPKDAQELRQLVNDAIEAGPEKGILFFDEVNRANREVQQAVFEIINDHRLNGRHLPSGWRVVSAINDDSDLYNVLEMDAAFLDRFFVIKFRPTAEEWFTWAKDNIHKAVYDFLIKYDSFLDPTKELIKSATTTTTKVHGRRSWEHFSRSIKALEEHDDEIGYKVLGKSVEALNLLFMTAMGHVGPVAAAQFKSFIETDYNILDAKAILNEWTKEIDDQLKKVVAQDKIPEIGAYNNFLIDYIKDITEEDKQTLNATQKRNLLKYLQIIPGELVMDFWVSFSSKLPQATKDWYDDPALKTAAHNVIMKNLTDPAAWKERTEA